MKRRYPLPDDRIFDNAKFMLHGYIVPSAAAVDETSTNETTNSKEVPIVLKQLNHWEIDTSIKTRGIWIKTDIAWYYLKDPCNVAVPKVTYSEEIKDGQRKSQDQSNLDTDAFFPSQESLHLPLRAKLGLLSNIIDIFTNQIISNSFRN